ncbi:MAG: polyphosphate polymerase domain-containing protein [Clostridiales bacterium]
MKKVYRNELKYMISKQESIVLSKRLSQICTTDPNSDSKGYYKVSSLYFDDYINSSLKDKLAGIIKRKKFRIRIYNDNDSFIKLERKSKNTNVCVKDSISLTKNEYNQIMSGNYEFMSNTQNYVLRDFYTLLRTRHLAPKVIVYYNRKTYVYPYGKVRITMDVDLHSSKGNLNLFKNYLGIPVTNTNEVILEIKYTGFLPSLIKDMIQQGIGNMEAISKYASCRMV